MGKIVLLAVAAAWAAVLIPPLLRSRVDNRPNSSVTDFRRQLSTLQRAVPTRGMVPMRSIGRPLAQSPLGRPAAHGRPGQVQRTASLAGNRSHGIAAPVERRAVHAERQPVQHRQVHLHRVSQRELVRRRRMNVLFVLVVATGLTMFLAATTKSQAMIYAFALAFVSLCGYCYKLVQLRNFEVERQYGEHNWFNAA